MFVVEHIHTYTHINNIQKQNNLHSNLNTSISTLETLIRNSMACGNPFLFSISPSKYISTFTAAAAVTAVAHTSHKQKYSILTHRQIHNTFARSFVSHTL